MLTVRRLPASGVAAVAVLLAALDAVTGLTAVGWWTGVLCGVVLNVLVARGLRRAGFHRPGPADLVTLGRAVVVCGVAALTADAVAHHGPVHDATTRVLVPIAALALALDAVDGWVARRTMSCSTFGGRFDGEVDAFLILVLSVHLAPLVGPWILSAGLVRYAFAVCGWVLPWMAGRLPYRYWRKVVTAAVGIVLVLAAAEVRPHWLTTGALALGLGLLAESFGRDTWWLWRHRAVTTVPAPVTEGLELPRRERV